MNTINATATADIPVPAVNGVGGRPTLLALNGRIGRVRYFLFGAYTGFAFAVLALCLIGWMVLTSHQDYMALLIIPYVFVLFAHIVIAKRRMNDLGESGWKLLLMFVPLVNIWVGIRMMFCRGTEGENQFGAPPEPNSRVEVVLCWTVLLLSVGLGVGSALAVHFLKVSY